jgi:hypothetical protein
MEKPDLEAKRTLAVQQIAVTLQSILSELVAIRVLQQKQTWPKTEQ